MSTKTEVSGRRTSRGDVRSEVPASGISSRTTGPRRRAAGSAHVATGGVDHRDRDHHGARDEVVVLAHGDMARAVPASGTPGARSMNRSWPPAGRWATRIHRGGIGRRCGTLTADAAPRRLPVPAVGTHRQPGGPPPLDAVGGDQPQAVGGGRPRPRPGPAGRTDRADSSGSRRRRANRPWWRCAIACCAWMPTSIRAAHTFVDAVLDRLGDRRRLPPGAADTAPSSSAAGRDRGGDLARCEQRFAHAVSDGRPDASRVLEHHLRVGAVLSARRPGRRRSPTRRRLPSRRRR